MLKHGRFQFGSAVDDRVEFWRMAAASDPKLYSDHWTVAHAAIEFSEAFFKVIRIEIDKAKRAMAPFLQSGEDFVVLPAHVIGRRVVRPVHAHENAQAIDAHAVGKPDELAETFAGRFARYAGEVAMNVPNHVAANSTQATKAFN